MTTAITASTYNIELRDKDGNLKTYLTPFVSKINWEWNRIGGCGRCSLTINKAYRDIIFDARDDIQIRVASGTTSKLVYRGYIANITPTLKINQEIVLDVRGYFDLLKKIVVQNAGDTYTYPAWDSYIKTVSHFDGADAATAYTDPIAGAYTFAANAQLDTAQKKFGTASLLLDGTGDYVSLPDSASWSFGTGNFTIDFWVRFNSVAGYQYFFAQEDDGTHYLNLYWNGVGAQWIADFRQTDGTQSGLYRTSIATTDPPELNTWYHIAFCRNGTGAYFFINGVSQTLTEVTAFGTTATGNFAAVLKIGDGVNGWIDEYRVSKGIARYIVNFTPRAVAYSNNLISDIAESIVDTFIIPNSPITKGTIDTGSFIVDSIDFLTTVEDALRTLAELSGDIEYGVDEDLVFYWRTESTTINHRFFVGNNVAVLERRVLWDNLVNKIYLVGGDVAGVKYKKTGESTDSQSSYYLAEEIINNSSIITSNVATQYMSAILSERSNPQFSIRAQVKNIDIRLEDTIPMGLVTFYDATYDKSSLGDLIGDIIGETSDGGSNITIGLLADGGSDVYVGGEYSAQIDRISYELSDTPGRFNIEIQLGDIILETAAKIKRLERELASITQY